MVEESASGSEGSDGAKSWLARIIVAGLVSSLCSGMTGYFLGGSAAEKQAAALRQQQEEYKQNWKLQKQKHRAELKQQVLKVFSETTGKPPEEQKATLVLIRRMVAEYADLTVWAEEQERELDAQIEAKHKKAVEKLRSELSEATREVARLTSELVRVQRQHRAIRKRNRREQLTQVSERL